MRILWMLTFIFLSSCATVVNNSNFDTPNAFSPPQYKKSISITVFVKLYNEEGEFYGYGYNQKMTDLMVQTFKSSKAFTRVEALSSTCSESYVCLDIPSSKKIKMQRHLNIIIPELYPKRQFSTFTKVLSVITLGLFPAYYAMDEKWEVNMFNNKREQLYNDDTTYEGKAMSAVWLHFRNDKLKEFSDEHYDEFYGRIAKQICKNIIFQLKRFP